MIAFQFFRFIKRIIYRIFQSNFVAPIFLILWSIFSGCGLQKNSGEDLAKQYCGSCHQFTPPEMLDKITWKKSVLPEMAFRMGLINLGNNNKSFDELEDAYPLLPKVPLINEKDFALIVDYFVKNAPDSLTAEAKTEPDSLTQFDVIPLQSKGLFPMNSLVMKDSMGRIFVGGRRNTLQLLDENFNVRDNFFTDSPPSCIRSRNSKVWCLQMGIMDPNDKTRGELVEMDILTRNSKVLIDSLRRPVYFEIADLNQDHSNDVIICEFGNYAGRLSVYESLSNESYRLHSVEAVSGARKVIVRDLNNDKKPDLIALFAQGNESINIFWNRGDFNFEKQQLISFPAVYGASYFEIADFNKDGNFDILVTNGDNSDYSPILKPYHGVRMFLNDGHFNFKQSWFYPINGASWSAAKDFDQDGDLDFAVMAFFPDFKNRPLESFIYFENKHGAFTPYVTAHAIDGRWLVMETGDFDNDSDDDILLGALNFNPENKNILDHWKKKPVSLLLLKNKHVKKPS